MAPPVTPKPRPLSLPEYVLKAKQSYRFEKDSVSLQKLQFGFFGEVGGLLAFVKKSDRDHLNESINEAASEEIGDALWYLMMIVDQLGLPPNDVGSQCLAILSENFGEKERKNSVPVTFRHIDGIVDSHHGEDSINRTIQLRSIANSAGVLAGHGLEGQSVPTNTQHIGKILSELVLVCASFELHIEEVAKHNLDKISSRWPNDEGRKHAVFFDEDFPEHEVLPRKIEIEFIERGTKQKGYVVQRLNGVFIGDPLTDNNNEPDDYRFHDVFHLAYMAFLGWSPVMRALLKRKRKSSPKIDENEDGARAIITEEGIATWIFNHAKRHQLYEGIEVGKLPYSILKQIQSMVHGYEVQACKLWQWELAILEGFKVFRELTMNRGGIVIIDLNERTLVYKLKEG